MKNLGGTIRLAATDISNHLFCGHLTALNVSESRGERVSPPVRAPHLVVIQERGLDHERAYIEHLLSEGLSIKNLDEYKDDVNSVAETLKAMAAGIEVIVQGALKNDRWFGRPDVLRRIEVPSNFGSWSYEPYDCKLARETKAATILQLSHYAALLTAVQGCEPETMYVVPPSPEFNVERYRVLDYAAYYRSIKARLEKATAKEQPTFAEPNGHCDVCRWWPECDREWRRDDHLSLTAGISRLQRKQLIEWEVPTVEALSRLTVPLVNKPRHGSRDGYVRIREQARVQVAGRYQRQPVHELLAIELGRGLTRLPEPSPGDISFDLESDPFVGTHGREYLFGFGMQSAEGRFDYQRRWALSAADEKAAFEWFVDFAMEQWKSFPAMHIYHYSPKEPSALKTLMGRYATREDAIDRMLRAGIFVDLHSITKQSLRASVEQYSLKALEEFHGFKRNVPLDEAKAAMRQVEHGLELGRITEVDADTCERVEGYNADDCRSTFSLRDWLEGLRRAEVDAGTDIPRPKEQDGEPPETLNERQARVAGLIAALTHDLPADETERTDDQSARWLLANLLDWHRREAKVAYWEKFRLRDLDDEELRDERAAIGGLEFAAEIPPTGRKKLPIHQYSFPPQETNLQLGKKVYTRDGQIGTIEEIDPVGGTVGIRKTGKALDVHPRSVYSYEIVGTDEQADSLVRLADYVTGSGFADAPPFRTASGLLLRHPPWAQLLKAGEGVVEAAKRLVHELDGSVLPIQGPPGAGKTFTAACMIIEAVSAGKRVGVTASSHKVIRNLLDDVQTEAIRQRVAPVNCLQKVSEKSEENLPDWLKETTDNAEAVAAIQTRTCAVLAGTAWLWAREEAVGLVDMLFVDEAGQMSLANAVAIAPAARNLILLGDPQQLDQPLQGSHPDGAEVSALEHLLQGGKTIAPDRGLFLDKTWRLHPEICRFTSELFYETRLESRGGLENQRIEGHPWLGSFGLRYLPVKHEGNQHSAVEEVDYIASIVESLLVPEVHWVDDGGNRRRLSREEILIVAPYNAQVAAISRRLPGMRVGTVDKFQGQQAPVVIYSLTTSSPEDAPRGMEFLYSLNRLNVATSRAKALAILVGSPKLLEPECKTPRQLQLANALCRYVELAGFVEDLVISAT
ncbi:MAG: TM0106 family RecB-like putative nuclease [Acidobacteria bacterium]|nr:TM0106 family RecB-like putative nuclease [Acidobacteriota bacterium]